MATYRNDVLHLSYSYPAAFTDASSLVGTALQAGMDHTEGGGKDMAHCLTVPFSAMETNGGGFSVVVLGRSDATCMKKTFTAAQLPEFTQSEATELTASGAKPQFAEPVAFTTGGHAAELMRGTFALPTGQRLHAMVACVLLKPDVACWQFLGSSDEQLNRMSAFPVSFDGGQPVPVVPPTVLGKP